MRQKSSGVGSPSNNEEILWAIFPQMKKNQWEFYQFARDQHNWHKRLYSLHKCGVMNKPLMLSKHILWELLKEDEHDVQKQNPKRNTRPIGNLDKNGKRQKSSKKKVSFDTRPKKISGLTLKTPQREKQKKKIVKKVKIIVKKADEKVSLIKDLDMNIPAEEEDSKDDQTINDLIKEVDKDKEELSEYVTIGSRISTLEISIPCKRTKW